MPAPLFTREQIYSIRSRFDAGESAASVGQDFPRASLETLRRIGRRETYREIGVGPAERPLISNRLAGEARQAGDPAPQAPSKPAREFDDFPELADIPDLTPEQAASARRLAEEVASTPRADPVGKFLNHRKETPA
jgi:hypothetical protein